MPSEKKLQMSGMCQLWEGFKAAAVGNKMGWDYERPPLVFFSFVFQMEKCPTNQTEMGSDYERPASRFPKGKCTTKMKCGIWSLRLVMQGHRGIQFFSFKHGPSF